MDEPNYRVWIDLETTGLDENADPILEIAMIVTDAAAPFKVISESAFAILPEGQEWPRRMDAFILRMHHDSGLLAEVLDHGAKLQDVVQQLIAALRAVSRKHDFIMAGSGNSHFDHRFLDAQMPRLSSWLVYPNVDVGVLRRSLVHYGLESLVDEARAAGFVDPAEGQHRALNDIRRHLGEERLYAERIGAAVTGSTQPRSVVSSAP